MKNDWEKKATCSAYLSTIIKQIVATSAWDLTRSTSLSSLHPTATVQLIPYIYPAFVPFGRYFTSIHLSLWIRQSPLSSTRWHFLFWSRRVHIEGHMNRFEFLLSWTIIPITIVFGSFFSKNRILCSITRC